MSLDLENLGLSALIKLRDDVSQVIHRKFERHMALAFTDVVGSTTYFQKFGDEAGRALHQRHLSLLAGVLGPVQGRIVDTAGDGAFTVFPTARGAIQALVALQQQVEQTNLELVADHQMYVRAGVHWGPVLTDGATVCGDSVNLCARVTNLGQGFEIVLTNETFLELSNEERLRCRPLRTVQLDGILRVVEVLRLLWRDQSNFPTRVRVEETNDVFELPSNKQIITFGRLSTQGGLQGNDIVLRLGDPELSKRISRWHFELRRKPDGYHLRSVSQKATLVDGSPVTMNEDTLIRPGTQVQLAGVATLTFIGEGPVGGDQDDPTLMGRG
jgi:class 3 adenylate cyclase